MNADDSFNMDVIGTDCQLFGPSGAWNVKKPAV
jgi:hypothetical protein